MAKCVDNPATGRIGCGVEYGGETQHCVARVAWSTHPDGMAHISARSSTIDFLWSKGRNGVMADPADHGIEPNDRGYWRKPMDEDTALALYTPKEQV